MGKLRNSVHRFIDVNGPLITLLPQGFYPKFQRMDPSFWTWFVVRAGLGPFGSEPEYLLTPLSTQGPINLFGRISAKNSCCQKISKGRYKGCLRMLQKIFFGWMVWWIFEFWGTFLNGQISRILKLKMLERYLWFLTIISAFFFTENRRIWNAEFLNPAKQTGHKGTFNNFH